MHQHVVRCNTGLSTVQAFDPGNARRGDIQVGGFIQDYRTFPTQFEGNGSQVFGCCRHYDLSDARAAGKKNMVKGQGQQFLRH